MTAKCPICGEDWCVYQAIPGLEDDYFYIVNGAEVTKAEYVAAERRCGFFNTLGHPDEPATARFSAATGTWGRTGSDTEELAW